MAHLDEAGNDRAGACGRTLAATLLKRLQGLVAPEITDPADRKVHAGAMGALIAVGLAAALACPFAGLFGFGLHAVVAPTVVAGACLAMAGSLAAFGRLDAVLGTAATLFAALAGLAAAGAGGLHSPFLLFLLVPAIEAALAGRRTLAGFALGIGCLVVGGVALCQWTGAGSSQTPAFGVFLTAGLWLLYLGLQALRLTRARQRAKSAREQSTIEQRLIDDALSDAVLRLGADGRLLFASTTATALLGREPGGALTADHVLSRMHVTDRLRYLQALGDIRAGQASAAVDIRMQVSPAEQGRFADVVLKLLSVRGADGTLLSVLCLIRDVTQERASTADLQRALAVAKENSEAKSQFLAAISHELRTPLNAIIGFSDVLDQEFFGGFEDPRQKEYVGLIRQSGGHLLAVVNGLLDVAKIEAGRYDLQMEAFAADEALHAAADLIRAEAAGKGLTLTLHLGNAAGAEIVADRRACHQMLLNLLSNAVKFTDEGGIALSAALKDGHFMVSVSDTGIGIAADDIGRLGQPFTQLSSGLARRYQGTGLGLSLVKGLCELHHGSMDIASEAGRGTAVTVRIPLDCAARIEASKHSKENVVALSHARKKTPTARPDASARRTA